MGLGADAATAAEADDKKSCNFESQSRIGLLRQQVLQDLDGRTLLQIQLLVLEQHQT